MSLPNEKEESLYGVQNMMKNFLPDDDPMMIFSKEIYPLFNDKLFADCYSEVGRNGKSPSFLAMVTLLQWKESLSDEETCKAVNTRIDWKIALHLEIEDKDLFEASTLCVFRRRLKEKEKICLIFDTILNQVRNKGFIKDHTKQRIDATHIVKHVNRISTTDLLFRTVKKVLMEIKKTDTDYYAHVIPEQLKERYGEGFSSFGYSKEKRGDKMAEIVEDGFLLNRLITDNPKDTLRELKQLSIMDTIFSENVIIRKKVIEDKEFIEVEEIETPKQSIFTPEDETLKMGKKGKTSWVGEKCHVVETAEKGEVNFIVGMIQQAANENDNKILPELLKNNVERGFKPEKTYADSNYISGSAIREFEERDEKLMGFIQQDTSNKPDAFKMDQFQIDLETMSAVCPAGLKSEKHLEYQEGYRILFQKKTCMACKFFKECVGNRIDKRRILHVGKDYYHTTQRRIEQKDKDFKKEMSVRAQVEGTISQGVRFYGLRYIKYAGKEGRQFQYYMVGAAINFMRYVKKSILMLNHSVFMS